MEEVVDENLIVVRSFESAINLLQDMENIETIWNIGGREVYELGLNSPLIHQAIFLFLSVVFRISTFQIYYLATRICIYLYKFCSCMSPVWRAIFRLTFSFLKLTTIAL